MPAEEDDDLYDGDYEFVDDEEEYEDGEEYEYEYEDEGDVEEEVEPAAAEAVEEEPEEKPKKKAAKSKPAASKKATPKKKEPAKSPKKAPAKKQKQKEIFDEAPADKQPAPDEAPAVADDAPPEEPLAAEAGSEAADEYGRPAPTSNYVVHVYEHKKFLRTIDRTFTPEEADAFASEYNRCSKVYGRWAAPGKADVKPGKVLAP